MKNLNLQIIIDYVSSKNENPQNANYPFDSSKINNLIKEESKFKYLNKNIIILDKKKMNENLEEKQNVEIDEEKVVKDALDAWENRNFIKGIIIILETVIEISLYHNLFLSIIISTTSFGEHKYPHIDIIK